MLYSDYQCFVYVIMFVGQFWHDIGDNKYIVTNVSTFIHCLQAKRKNYTSSSKS